MYTYLFERNWTYVAGKACKITVRLIKLSGHINGVLTKKLYW